ncbi:TPA: hypothetical protein MIP25_24475 [Klebsiella pneumoniae]|nr:hypothetical protein [Klebsiella pneumoniae]
MPAFEWVHVQLHQQKGMISLSPPTICNSAEKFICFLDRYIRWYNEKRIKLSLGAMSPVKYRQHLGITT